MRFDASSATPGRAFGRPWTVPFVLAAAVLAAHAALTALTALPLAAQDYPHPLRGSVERVTVRGASLDGNLSGDPAERFVSVYLPPGYGAEPARRYPVLYALHGYTDDDLHWMGWQSHFVNLAMLADSAIAAGRIPPLIVVMPNAYTRFHGSMYSNSITTGYWEEYLSRDLVGYVDAHYRTIPERASRGLLGHSMGGYGAVRLAMKQPEVFAAVYSMSPGCIGDCAGVPDAAASARHEAVGTMADFARADFLTRAQFAISAAWAPNPARPPFFLDLPTRDGVPQPAVLAKLAANTPLAMLDQYVPGLRRLRAFGIDAGDEDRAVAAAVTELHLRLARLGVPHSYGIYPGGHTSRVAHRIATAVLPFFARHLVFAEP